MGFFKRLFGIKETEVVLDTQWHDTNMGPVSDTAQTKYIYTAEDIEYVEEPVPTRTKERKPKKLNKGLTKKVKVTKPKKKV